MNEPAVRELVDAILDLRPPISRYVSDIVEMAYRFKQGEETWGENPPSGKKPPQVSLCGLPVSRGVKTYLMGSALQNGLSTLEPGLRLSFPQPHPPGSSLFVGLRVSWNGNASMASGIQRLGLRKAISIAGSRLMAAHGVSMDAMDVVPDTGETVRT